MPDAGPGEHAGLTLSFNDCVKSNVFATPSTASAQIASIVAADFDRDGTSDVAVGTWTDNRVVTLKGKGDGTFQIVSTKTFATIPRGLCLADLNGDGTPDVVTGGPAAKSVNVMLGGAGCSIADPVSYAGTTAGGIAAGDVDNDGHLDLVVGNLDGTLSFGVYLGTGTGTLDPVFNVRAAPSRSLPCSATSIATGPWTSPSGRRTSTPLASTALVLHGVGDGTFDAPAVYPTPSKIPSGNVAADFTSDGVLDLLTFYTNGYGATIMRSGTATARSRRRARSPSSSPARAGGRSPTSISTATSTSQSQAPPTCSQSIRTGDGDGTFAAAANFNSMLGPGTMVATDFDGDGKPDLVVGQAGISSSPQLCVLKNTSR